MSIEPSPRMAICLAIDLKKSTNAGLTLTTKRFDRFNLALVRQVSPHLATVGLDNVLIKFTGDGWLIISDDPEDAARLCCLALIMARQFQREISREASLPLFNVPALRLAVCWGRDLVVELPNGQRDFVGNSVRHAVRASQLCRDNEILIDDTVLRWISHDFITGRVLIDERRRENPEAKWEEDLSLHVLEELRPEAALEVDAPEYFVNMLAVFGRSSEAATLADRVADSLQREAGTPDADRQELLERFNRLLAASLDDKAVQSILADMQEAGLQPDVETYNAILAKPLAEPVRQRYLEQMRADGIQPTVKTYTVIIKQEEGANLGKWLTRIVRDRVVPDTILLNTLIERATNHEAAMLYLQEMESRGAKPNAITYGMLLAKAEKVRHGCVWVERMFRDGITPELETFRTLFGKDFAEQSGEELLEWFLALPYHPAEAMSPAIAEYRKAGRVDDALRLSLDYPYSQAAEKLFRQYPERTLTYFEEIVEHHPDHPNGNYALGLALVTLKRPQEALPYLRQALRLAGPSTRREEIQRYLDRITPQNNGYPSPVSPPAVLAGNRQEKVPG